MSKHHWFNFFKKPLFLLIVLSSLVAVEPLFHQGIFTAHDIEANLGRFAAFFNGIKEGHLLPSWAGYVAKGYGSPVLMFSYLLPYILQLPLKIVGLSFEWSAKIYIFFATVTSAVLMFSFLRKSFSQSAAFFGSLLYVYAPYRISDIYARGSISEITAFMLVPGLGILLYRYIRKQSYDNFIFLGLGGFLLFWSHPFFMIISSVFFIGYIIFIIRNEKIKRTLRIICGLFGSALMAMLAGAFFLAPFLGETKYLHYDISPFTSSWSTQFVDFKKILLPVWTFIDVTGKLEYQTWQIGIFHILLLISGIIVLFYRRLKQRDRLFLGVAVTFLSIYLMTAYSYPVYEIFKPLQHIQFPWRFAALTIIALSWTAAAVYDALADIRIFNKKFVWVGVVLIIMLLYLPYAKGHGYHKNPDRYYQYELPHNTEGLATTPVWAAAPELYPWASYNPRIIDGLADIDYIFRSSTEHFYNVKAKTPVYLVDDTFYFPNWQVFANGKAVQIEFQNPDYRGLITYRLPVGVHKVEVRFLDTKLRRFAKYISFGTLVFLGIIWFISIKKRRQNAVRK